MCERKCTVVGCDGGGWSAEKLLTIAREAANGKMCAFGVFRIIFMGVIKIDFPGSVSTSRHFKKIFPVSRFIPLITIERCIY